MTPKEMIEVIAAFERGGKIEYRWNGQRGWAVTNTPGWNFSSRDYRIAPPKPKMVKHYGWRVKASGQVLLLCGGETDTPPASRMERLPHLDCELPE